MTNPGGFKPAGPLNAYRPPVKARNTSLSKCKKPFINFIIRRQTDDVAHLECYQNVFRRLFRLIYLSKLKNKNLSFIGLNVSGRSAGPW